MDKMNEITRETSLLGNPFEKVTVEQLNDDYSLIAYLFARPQQAIYNKLIGRENYIIVGGWGSGKTMLLKYLGLGTQIAALGANKVKSSDFIGVYTKAGRGSFKPFLKPGGEFKEGGEILFGHYFNLFTLEEIISVILYGMNKAVFAISQEEEAALYEKIMAKFSFIKNTHEIGFIPSKGVDYRIYDIRKKIADYRREVETFLNIRDLEKDLSYKDQLTIHPTDIRTFLDEVIKDIREIILDFSQRRFYILLDECELFSKGQQQVVNTIIKQRLTTLVFKLTTRPPGIQTMDTIDEGIGLTDRECKHLYLDKEYDPTSTSFRQLCKDVAKKRLEKYGYQNTDIRQILGKYTIEDALSREEIVSYLKKSYPSKKRVSDEKRFKTVYKDFKVAAAFQILSKKKLKKRYAGFNTFVMLSSGIMLHFLELCRDTFNLCFGQHIVQDNSRNILFKQIPLPIEIQDKAAESVSENFYRDIKGRAESLKESPVDMEFGGKIQYIISVLGGLFREKLMSFNEPEAARIEIPEGITALNNNTDNPIRQMFTNAIAISVFQEGNPYMPRHIGGIRPPTYILNRILAPYCKISSRPRWRTKIPAEIFNNILKDAASEFKKEVFRGKKVKKREIEKEKPAEERQLALSFMNTHESMPVLSYLTKKIQGEPFKRKILFILLHFLRDFIPFIESCKTAGALPSDTFVFFKDYQYPNKEKIKAYLEKQKYKVSPVKEIDHALRELVPETDKGIIVIEDGGIIVPKLNRDFEDLVTAMIGAVEQTTKGIRNDQKIGELSFPVISIPGSKLKDTFEPPHVARATVNSIQRLLPDKNFSGKRALVIGYGNIGEQIALQLRDNLKMRVSVYDIDDTKLIKANQSGLATEESRRAAVKGKSLIIGATGEQIIGRGELLAMEHNVHLASASSEQWEFCISELDALSSEKTDLSHNGERIGTRYRIRNTEKQVNLVADGYPINFWKTESLPNEVSDLIMSLIFVSAIEIATNTWLTSGINEKQVDKLTEEYELGKIYLEYHSK